LGYRRIAAGSDRFSVRVFTWDTPASRHGSRKTSTRGLR
jgi:hypothetical protein